MALPADQYAIHLYGELTPSRTLLEKTGFPQGRCHSFLMLTKNGAPVSELHFSGKNSAGKTVHSLRLLNAFATAAGFASLEPAFNRLIKTFGLNRYFLHLEAVQIHARHIPGAPDLVKLAKIEDSPAQILGHWNNICRASLAINQADIPFTQSGNFAPCPGPANCHAGIKTALSTLGPAFTAAIEALASQRARFLNAEVTLPAPLTYRTEDLPQLLAEQEILARKLCETSGYGNERRALLAIRPRLPSAA